MCIHFLLYRNQVNQLGKKEDLKVSEFPHHDFYSVFLNATHSLALPRGNEAVFFLLLEKKNQIISIAKHITTIQQQHLLDSNSMYMKTDSRGL